MIQRRNRAPPRQYLVTVEVRLDQPYLRRSTRAIRRREKSTPALRPDQLEKRKSLIDRSPFVFCPQIHCHVLPAVIATEESASTANENRDYQRGLRRKPDTPRSE